MCLWRIPDTIDTFPHISNIHLLNICSNDETQKTIDWMLVLICDEEPVVQSKTSLWPCIQFSNTTFQNSFYMSNMWIWNWNPEKFGETPSMWTWSLISDLFLCETWKINIKKHLDPDLGAILSCIKHFTK